MTRTTSCNGCLIHLRSAAWFAEQIGKEVGGAVDVDIYWRNLLATLRSKLPPEIVLTNRQGTAKVLGQWVESNPGVLIIRAPSPREMVDVFVAWVHTLSRAQVK